MNEDGTISSLSVNSENLNYEITNLIQKYRGAYIKLGNVRTAKMGCLELKEELLKTASPESEFIDFVEFARMIIAKTVKRKTANWYESSLNAFIAFYGSGRIDAKDIKSKTLESFKEYLENRIIIVKNKGEGEIDVQRRMEPGSINNYLRGIRSLYNKARRHFNNEDYDIIRIPNNPFARISIPEYVRKRKSLPIDAIIRIRDASLIVHVQLWRVMSL